MDSKVRGAFLAQVMFGELEKISGSAEFHAGHEAFQAMLHGAKPNLVEALKPGKGSFFGAVKQRLAIGKLSRKAKGKFHGDIEGMRAAAIRGLQSGDMELQQAAARELADINQIHGKGGEGGSSYMKLLQGGKGAQGGSKRSAALLGTGVGLGIAGTAYAAHKMGQPDQPEY